MFKFFLDTKPAMPTVLNENINKHFSLVLKLFGLSIRRHNDANRL